MLRSKRFVLQIGGHCHAYASLLIMVAVTLMTNFLMEFCAGLSVILTISNDVMDARWPPSDVNYQDWPIRLLQIIIVSTKRLNLQPNFLMTVDNSLGWWSSVMTFISESLFFFLCFFVKAFIILCNFVDNLESLFIVPVFTKLVCP